MAAVPSLPALVAVDAVAWVTVQVGTGYLVHRLPRRLFEDDGWLYRQRAAEAGGRLYVRGLRIKRWKKLLPEAGDLFAGGFDKAALARCDDAYLATYVLETRRAELGHWLALAPAPLFFLWNPWPLGVLMQAYALVVNGPCIASQRYNRLRLQRVLGGRHGAQRKMAER